MAHADRGNYPVVAFTDDAGDSHDYVPSVVALTDDGLVYGFDALAAHETGAPLTRSFKRALAAPDVTATSPIVVGDQSFGVLEVLTGFLRHLRNALVERSNVAPLVDDEGLASVAVAVPAHAHGAQRFLTLQAFRAAGFDVAAMINEPSAAGFEYTHRRGATLTARRTRVLVYDLGGGTFDASLVHVDGIAHEVIDSAGLNRLGGDDFDAVLAARALAAAGTSRDALSPAELEDLLSQARDAKENVAPQTRRLALEVAGSPAGVRIDDFYGAAAPLVEQTLAAMEPLVPGLDTEGLGAADVAGVYLVGGASALPLVARLLRERFGRRVHRSPLPAASTAIGLAIAADPSAGYSLTDRLSRGFGVFRERDAGAGLAFDPILSRDERVAPNGTVAITRRYRAAHDVGWVRFVGYAGLAGGGPRGELVPFGEVLFPFDPALRDGRDLSVHAVQRRDDGPLVEETYTVDAHGIVSVRIADLDTGYEASASLG